MNWRGGFKRLEVIYAVCAAIVIVALMITAGGGDGTLETGFKRLTRPAEAEWVLHYPDTHQTTRLVVPRGMTATWVTEAATRLEEWRDGCRVTFVRDLAFDGKAAGIAGLLWAAGFLAPWLFVKIFLWVLRGFRTPA